MDTLKPLMILANIVKLLCSTRLAKKHLFWLDFQLWAVKKDRQILKEIQEALLSSSILKKATGIWLATIPLSFSSEILRSSQTSSIPRKETHKPTWKMPTWFGTIWARTQKVPIKWLFYSVTEEHLMATDIWTVTAAILLYGWTRTMKGSLWNGISRPNKASRTSLLSRLTNWEVLMQTILREICSTLLPKDKKLFGISKYKWCLKKMLWSTNGTSLISLKYGHTKTIHCKM